MSGMWLGCSFYEGVSCRFSGGGCMPSAKRDGCPFEADEVYKERARVAEASELVLATYCARGGWSPLLFDLTDPSAWIQAARDPERSEG